MPVSSLTGSGLLDVLDEATETGREGPLSIGSTGDAISKAEPGRLSGNGTFAAAFDTRGPTLLLVLGALGTTGGGSSRGGVPRRRRSIKGRAFGFSFS